MEGCGQVVVAGLLFHRFMNNPGWTVLTSGFASALPQLQRLTWSPKLRGRYILNVTGLPFRAFWPSSRARFASSIRSRQSGSQPETGAVRAGSTLALPVSSLPRAADTTAFLNRDMVHSSIRSSYERTLQLPGQPRQHPYISMLATNRIVRFCFRPHGIVHSGSPAVPARAGVFALSAAGFDDHAGSSARAEASGRPLRAGCPPAL